MLDFASSSAVVFADVVIVVVVGHLHPFDIAEVADIDAPVVMQV